MKNETPAACLYYRPFGTDAWKGPLIIDAGTSWRDARQRSRDMMKDGVDGLENGKRYDWRFYRHGALVDCWDEDGR